MVQERENSLRAYQFWLNPLYVLNFASSPIHLSFQFDLFHNYFVSWPWVGHNIFFFQNSLYCPCSYCWEKHNSLNMNKDSFVKKQRQNYLTKNFKNKILNFKQIQINFFWIFTNCSPKFKLKKIVLVFSFSVKLLYGFNDFLKLGWKLTFCFQIWNQIILSHSNFIIDENIWNWDLCFSDSII